MLRSILFFLFFFFNDTATTEIYTLSLHDALPISDRIDSPRATRRHATHHPVHLVALAQQKLCEEGAVLARDARDERPRHQKSRFFHVSGSFSLSISRSSLWYEKGRGPRLAIHATVSAIPESSGTLVSYPSSLRDLSAEQCANFTSHGRGAVKTGSRQKPVTLLATICATRW